MSHRCYNSYIYSVSLNQTNRRKIWITHFPTKLIIIIRIFISLIRLFFGKVLSSFFKLDLLWYTNLYEIKGLPYARLTFPHHREIKRLQFRIIILLTKLKKTSLQRGKCKRKFYWFQIYIEIHLQCTRRRKFGEITSQAGFPNYSFWNMEIGVPLCFR